MTDLAGLLDYQPERLADCPAHLRAGLQRYIEDGVKPGGALRSVLCDTPLSIAVPRLDDETLAGVRGLVAFLYTFSPSSCWGSPSKVDAWALQGGLNGHLQARGWR